MVTTLYLSWNNMVFQHSLPTNFVCYLYFFLPPVSLVGMGFGFCDVGVVQSVPALRFQIPQQQFDWFSGDHVTISDSSRCGRELGD